jgi:hypothetical protein
VVGLRQDPTKIKTVHDSVTLLRIVIENCNRLFYLESTAVSFLHVRKLCPVSPQRPQRLCDNSPTSSSPSSHHRAPQTPLESSVEDPP